MLRHKQAEELKVGIDINIVLSAASLTTMLRSGSVFRFWTW